MICEKCGRDSECKTSKVYFAEIINVKQKSENKLTSYQTTTTTTYTKPKERDFNICIDCILKKKKKRDLLMVPLYLLIFVSIIGGIFQAGDVLMGVLGAVWLIGSAFAIASIFRKEYRTSISNRDVYLVAKTQLNRELKTNSNRTKYEFWENYPSHLKIIS